MQTSQFVVVVINCRYLAVQQRMNQLSQYVNEALWRLQLIEPDVQNAKFGAIDESLYKTCVISNDDGMLLSDYIYI